MPSVPPHGWPTEATYRYLEGACPDEMAWEWLRRDPDYHSLAPTGIDRTEGGICIAHPASPAEQARWGCLNRPAPERTWSDSPVLWLASVDPAVLTVMAIPVHDADDRAFDLRPWRTTATFLSSPDGEHLLLQGAGQSIRLDVISGTLTDGPVALFHELPQAKHLAPAINALRRLHHLCRTGEFMPVTATPSQQSRRMILALRVHDALAQGASIRDIGIMIHGHDRVRAEWPGSGDALKSQARRLIALARDMASGGYRKLLGKSATLL